MKSNLNLKMMMVMAMFMNLTVSCDSQGIHRNFGNEANRSSDNGENQDVETDPDLMPVRWEKIQQEILNVHCIDCHNERRARGGVRLDNYDEVRKGLMGTLLVPGKPEDSALYLSVVTGDMPKNADRLPEENLQALEEWILAGAPGPVPIKIKNEL